MKSRFKSLYHLIKYRKYLNQFKTIQSGPEICDLYWRMKNHTEKLFYCKKTGDYWKISVDSRKITNTPLL